MESILTSIKKLLNIDGECTAFDTDIIMHVNSVLMILTQLGIGPDKGFVVQDSEDTWIDFLGEDECTESVKIYVYLRVKLLFDPPASSAVIDSMKETIRELEWRIVNNKIE